MIRSYVENDYETISRSARAAGTPRLKSHRLASVPEVALQATKPAKNFPRPIAAPLKHGHVISFAALFLFTVVLYARPADFYPSVATNSLALILGLVTVVTFAISQLSLDGTLTARPSEVNLVLIFMLTGAISIPLAINPAVAWHEFSGTFIRCIVIFIVLVNVVRTEQRLKALMLLALVTGIW